MLPPMWQMTHRLGKDEGELRDRGVRKLRSYFLEGAGLVMSP